MRMMKTIALGLAMAAVAAPAMAASRHDGKWVSVAEKSYWSDGKFPKGFKLAIDMTWQPNKLIYRAVNTTNPDKPYLNNFDATLDDQVGPLTGNPRFNEIRIKQLGPDTYQVLEQKDGDVIVGQYWEFSKDGKSLIRWGTGKAPDGKTKAFLETFEKK